MNTISIEQYKGCLSGLALGDALALERLLWALIGKSKGKMRFTDDTQMTLDVAHSILTCGVIDQNHLANQFAKSYRWSRGYGPGAAKLLKKIRKGATWQQVNRLQFKDGSYGNGAAMRAPILALFYHENSQKLLEAVHQVSEITHAHPLGIEGAKLVSLAVFYCLHRKQPVEIIDGLINIAKESVFQTKLDQLKNTMRQNHYLNHKATVKLFGNGIAAGDSCVTALSVAFQFLDKPYLEMIGFIKKCRGDVDTIAAMAGAIWGARNGFQSIKQAFQKVESSENIEALAKRIFQYNYCEA